VRYPLRLLSLLILSTTGATGPAIQATPAPELLRQKWAAAWIAPPGQPTCEYGVYHFRKEFDLAVQPDQFLVHVSADNRYRLFVNGPPRAHRTGARRHRTLTL
jgi:alpha-L-rhamnosidase